MPQNQEEQLEVVDMEFAQFALRNLEVAEALLLLYGPSQSSDLDNLIWDLKKAISLANEKRRLDATNQ